MVRQEKMFRNWHKGFDAGVRSEQSCSSHPEFGIENANSIGKAMRKTAILPVFFTSHLP